ncbi:MAG: hypothetical protein AABX47_08405 [Nanoarchaeota archaeon]
MRCIPNTEEQMHEDDIYFEEAIFDFAEADALSPEEEGFMMGYLGAV